MPKPNVDSAVITLTLKDSSVSVKNEEIMFKIVKCAFGQRRKTLLNGLHNLGNFGLSKEDLTQSLEEAGFDSRIRGEALSVEQFALLADIIEEKIKK